MAVRSFVLSMERLVCMADSLPEVAHGRVTSGHAKSSAVLMPESPSKRGKVAVLPELPWVARRRRRLARQEQGASRRQNVKPIAVAGEVLELTLRVHVSEGGDSFAVAVKNRETGAEALALDRPCA